MKGLDLKVKELRDSLIREINNSGLPVSITSLVIFEIQQTLKAAELNAVATQKRLYEKEQSEKGSVEDGKEI